jgi:hypothetical protein
MQNCTSSHANQLRVSISINLRHKYQAISGNNTKVQQSKVSANFLHQIRVCNACVRAYMRRQNDYSSAQLQLQHSNPENLSYQPFD